MRYVLRHYSRLANGQPELLSIKLTFLDSGFLPPKRFGFEMQFSYFLATMTEAREAGKLSVVRTRITWKKEREANI